MKLTEINEAWEKDSKIDETNLGYSATRVPQLHSKYLKLLSNTRLQFRKAEAEFLLLRQIKNRYYRGELTKEELKEYGWEQYLLAKPLKNEMDTVINGDSDIIKMIDKLEYFRTTIYTLEQIIKSLNNRTWDIKNAIEWQKFTQGNY